MTSATTKSFHNVDFLSLSPDQLSEAEKRWVSFQPYLLSKGYNLRPRYQPNWVPSWKRTGEDPRNCEDGMSAFPLRVLDATRIQDQRQVIVKMVAPADDGREGAEELDILRHFSNEPFKTDPRNHVVPCLDSFPIPNVQGGVFYVMPLLSRYRDPAFYDLSEVHDFLDQIFEGLEFLHENDVAHCDIASPNIMMDGRSLYDEPFHPVHQEHSLDARRLIYPKYLRSQRPVRYHYIDFGYATWFRNATSHRMVTGSRARERAPEQIAGNPYDPFKADIYQLGAVIRRDIIPKYKPLAFLLPLAREMTSQDPSTRPTLSSAHRSMTAQFVGLGGFRNRWPIIPLDATFGSKCRYILAGVATEVVIFFTGILKLLFFQF
ncbi:kinase-like protein [Ceratobasidium sp. AG-I]|nr:kinase-like protein [Ceratobasidium sp. AG-I]